MASKRTLKRAVNKVSDELLADSMYCVLLSSPAVAEKAEELIVRTLDNRSEALARICCYPHSSAKEVKGYFNQLIADFSAEADAIADAVIELSGVTE
jgi:endonuclease III